MNTPFGFVAYEITKFIHVTNGFISKKCILATKKKIELYL